MLQRDTGVTMMLTFLSTQLLTNSGIKNDLVSVTHKWQRRARVLFASGAGAREISTLVHLVVLNWHWRRMKIGTHDVERSCAQEHVKPVVVLDAESASSHLLTLRQTQQWINHQVRARSAHPPVRASAGSGAGVGEDAQVHAKDN